jgi:hypothetical protein
VSERAHDAAFGGLLARHAGAAAVLAAALVRSEHLLRAPDLQTAMVNLQRARKS